MKQLFAIFTTFFRIGLLMFGGGYSMLPLLERELVEGRGWVTQEEVLDYFAIGQCVPGIISLNTATLVGFKVRGRLGALWAALGVLTPPLIVITVIAAMLEQFMHMAVVQHAFAGIRVAVCALILAAVYKLFKTNVLKPRGKDEPAGAVPYLRRNGLALLLCVAAFVLVGLVEVSPVFVIVGAAVFGLLFFVEREKR